jgi:hypothetical protein
VVKQHIGGAGCGGRRIIADDAIERERALDHVALEPAVEEIGGALREEVEQQPLVVEIEAQQALADAGALEQLEEAAASVGRRAQDEVAQDIGGTRERRLVGGKTLGIAAREGGDRRLPLGEGAAHQKIARRVDGPEVRRGTLDDL